jgi:LDH2 family malate/lactate/ureidoglycolate dehydrogenase
MVQGVDVKTFSIEELRHFCEEVFRYFDVPPDDARQAAAVLSAADRRGIDSHGVARLKTYVDLLRLGRINPQPNIEVVRETPSTATVDGDNGLGLVVGPRANALAMEKAESVGSGWVSVCNTNHYGIAGYYVLEALERDLIGMSMTNSTKLVAPHQGAERMLGTNPIAMAFPGQEEPPIVIDMATSCVAYGKVEIKRREQAEMPYGWAIDGAGHPTQDPTAMIEGGAQLPLGSDEERSGHKGYCLASMVDILTCVFSGANWGPFAPPFALRQEIPDESVGKGIGHFFGAWQIEGFRDPDEFKVQIDKWVRTFRATKPAPGFDEVLIPGDPERRAEAQREKEGVPVLGPVVKDLQGISEYTGISLGSG